jgi:hypothetical protein
VACRGFRLGRGARTTGTLLIVGFLGLILGRLTVDEVILDARHHVAEATITKVELRRSVDFALVEFQDATGARRTARIQLSWWPHDTEAGDGQRVDYDPSHPSRARRHGAHDPLALWPVVVGLGLATVLGRGKRGTRRQRARRRGEPSHAESGRFSEPQSNVHVRASDAE